MCDLCNLEKHDEAVLHMHELADAAKFAMHAFRAMAEGSLHPHPTDEESKKALARAHDALHDLAREFIEDWA